MSLALDDLPCDPDRLLPQLRQMREVIAQQNASLVSLQAERDAAWSERTAARTERDLLREKHDAAQAEIEKLQLLIRQLQRGQFGRRSERLDPVQLLSALESLILVGIIIARLPSLRAALTSARSTPFLLYCWILVILYAATFASFANFGLLVRQRSLVLPALFVLLAVRPGTASRPTATTSRRLAAGGVRGGR